MELYHFQQILLGEYDHRIEFDPPPENTASVKSHLTTFTEMPRGKAAAERNEGKRGNYSEEQETEVKPKRARTVAESSEEGWEEYADGAVLVFKKDMEGRAKVRINIIINTRHCYVTGRMGSRN